MTPTRTARPSSTTDRTAWSPTLGEDLRYRAHLTPGPAAPRRTLYLLHGREGSGADWDEALAALDALAERGAVPPLLVVVPDAPWSGRGSWYVDSAFTGEPRGRPVETALTTDLVRHVDAHHPTLADRDHRTVAGFSMGGAGALRLVLAHPDLFSGCVALGPAAYDAQPRAGSSAQQTGAFGRDEVRFDPDVYARLGYRAPLAALDGTRPVRLFVAVGAEDGLAPVAVRVHQHAARAPGVESRLRVLPGGHDLATAGRGLAAALPWVVGR